MSHKEIDELRALVRQDRRMRKGPFSIELRRRLQAFIKQRWQAGESLQELSRQLGVSDHTVHYWRSHWGERAERGVQLRRVEVIAERPLTTRTVTVHGPAETRIEGLELDEVVALWRKLGC